MPETISRSEALGRVRSALQREQSAFREEGATSVDELRQEDLLQAMCEVQARADLEETFFNPQSPIDRDLRAAIGVADDESLTLEAAGTAIDKILKDRAERSKNVTEGSLDSEIVDAFQGKLSAALKAALVD